MPEGPHLWLEANVARRRAPIWSRAAECERPAFDPWRRAASTRALDLTWLGLTWLGLTWLCSVYPGTLHAKGELVKTHTVHYSIGAAGKYLMHIGLRQKSATLPGSPFTAREWDPNPLPLLLAPRCC